MADAYILPLIHGRYSKIYPRSTISVPYMFFFGLCDGE